MLRKARDIVVRHRGRQAHGTSTNLVSVAGCGVVRRPKKACLRERGEHPRGWRRRYRRIMPKKRLSARISAYVPNGRSIEGRCVGAEIYRNTKLWCITR